MSFIKRLLSKPSYADPEESKSNVEELISPPLCPHCGFEFEKMPVRKRNCPSCKDTIYLIWHHSGKYKLIVKEDEYKKWSKWSTLIDNQAEIYRVVEEAEWEDMEDFIAQHKKAPIGDSKTKDEFWKTLQKYLLNNAEDYYLLTFIYGQLANILEFEGKDNSKMLEEAEKYKKLNEPNTKTNHEIAMEMGMKVIILSAGSDSCPSCQELDGKSFTSEEWEKKKPLPNPNCTHPKGCRCTTLYDRA